MYCFASIIVVLCIFCLCSMYCLRVNVYYCHRVSTQLQLNISYHVWNGHWESGLETYSTLLFLFLACAPKFMYLDERKSLYICVYMCVCVCIYIYIYIYGQLTYMHTYAYIHAGAVCSLLYGLLSGFSWNFRPWKKGGVAIDEPPRGPANEPVGRSWNRAFCYGLPVLSKLFWLLLLTILRLCSRTILQLCAATTES